MDKWEDYIRGDLTEEEIRGVMLEMGCNNCEEETGSKKCYTCVQTWAMDRISNSKKTPKEASQ